jgi:AcrR family transcriptional regulator
LANTAASSVDEGPLSHNLQGQRLGRKGRGTRERILAATERLLAGPLDAPISLSAVAREASLGMTTLYLYFSDLTELLLAVLEPVMRSAEQRYVGHVRERWPDDELADHCRQFVEAYHGFWEQNSRILHLRNSYADIQDPRMVEHRIETTRPLIGLLVHQMDGDPKVQLSPTFGVATTLLTAIERLVTVSTDANFPSLLIEDPKLHIQTLLGGAARLLELGIRDRRAAEAEILPAGPRGGGPP